MEQIFTPRDPHWETKCREEFAAQGFMRLVGASIEHLSPGHCHVAVALRDDLKQQVGFAHGGLIASIADTASGFASYSLMAPKVRVLTTEFKVHFLAPGVGRSLIAKAVVEKPGKTLVVVRCDVYSILENGEQNHCGLFLGTMMALTT